MATPEKIKALANLLDQIHLASFDALMALSEHERGKVDEQLLAVLKTVHHRLVAYLAYTDDMLVGAELCNECGEVESTVVKIEREPDLMIVTDNGGFYPQDMDYGWYFRLPGSAAYGEPALAELARARADQAGKKPQSVSA